MSTRRVGTLTLGILLISVGITFFLSTFFNLHLERQILKFWPLTLISLGIEILVLNRMSLKQKMHIKYDFISFLLITLILLLSFGTYAFGNLIVSGTFYH